MLIDLYWHCIVIIIVASFRVHSFRHHSHRYLSRSLEILSINREMSDSRDFTSSAEEIISLQLKYYNEKNLSSFLSLFSEDCVCYDYPDTLLIQVLCAMIHACYLLSIDVSLCVVGL